MESTPPTHRSRRRQRLGIALSLAAAVTIAALTALALLHPATAPPASASRASATTRTATTPSPTPSPTPTPLTPAQALLETRTDPKACAVSFAGAGITHGPQLQTQGKLYRYLPIPRRTGAVFAGWYASPKAAASADTPSRVNGADVVTCTGRQVTLYAAWTTPAAVKAADVGVPILLYHRFTTNPAGEPGSLRRNYMYTGDFDAQMAYLADHHFYLPTWDELSAFIDGKLALPHDSVIITDDDADTTWLELGVPIIEKHKLLTTSFVITRWRSEPSPSIYVLQRSHTHDMHDAGANGRGKMVNYSADQIAADMRKSAKILGVKEVMAYPFGDYDEAAKQGLREAGFAMARTTHHGYVHAGTDKLALPCIRMSYGTRVNGLVAQLG
ncbi:polysaccharide deacetylase family protein [Xylanimonas sp. McL0601]|uniref:polysaccharide deacetylase family protein n=1 Tax=Xylanimonas sp. McL0601 TaxID=3414739 RepID=UPI003CF9798C